MSKTLKIILGIAALGTMVGLSQLVPDIAFDMPHGTPPGEHWNLLVQFLPGLVHNLHGLVAPYPSFVEGTSPGMVTHMLTALLVVSILVVAGFAARRNLARRRENLVPEPRFSALAILDWVSEALLGFMEGIMGRRKAERFFPLIATLALFILVSNLMGLLPGMAPTTDTLNTTLALGIVVFAATHYYGFSVHGAAYIRHFIGPFPQWYAFPFMILMFVVEMLSNLVRPVSLALRLMGNMMGDHRVLFAFMGFGILFAPLPILILGAIVCVVQALVFSLLSIIYIGLATEEHHD